MYDKFDKLLKSKGVSAYRLCKDTGIGRATISDWKNGKTQPKRDKIQKIADYFQLPLSYFYSDDDVDKAWEEHIASIDYELSHRNCYDVIKTALNGIDELKNVKFTDEHIKKIIEYAQFIAER